MRRRNGSSYDNARGKRGQALVEVALLMPFLLVIVLGIIELGRFAHYNALVSSAARAGVQYGQRDLITAVDTSGMQAAALAGAPNVAGLTATATSYCECADGSASSCLPSDCAATYRLVYVSVTASLTYQPLFHFLHLPGSLHITHPAVMQVAP